MTRRRLLSLLFSLTGVLMLGVLLFWLSSQHRDEPAPLTEHSERAAAEGEVKLPKAPEPLTGEGEDGSKASSAAAVTGVAPDHLNQRTRAIVNHAARGEPFSLRLGEEAPVQVRFSPMTVTTEDFQLSVGPEEELPSTVHAFSGKVMLGGGQAGPGVNMVVVNEAVSLSFARTDGDYLVSLDTATGQTTARKLVHPHDPFASGPGNSCAVHEGVSHFNASPHAAVEPEIVAAAFEMTGVAGMESQPVSAAVNGKEGNWVDHQHFRLGPLYDASLLDMTLLFVLDKDATGSDSSKFDDKAADFISYAARTADAYERQLGLRILLMELILIPDSAAYSSPGTRLTEFSTWLSFNRPQSLYNWGHAARWGKVRNSDGTLAYGNVIGRAYLDSYGGQYGVSESEPNYSYSVFSHELGHNVGADHTSGGIMNGSLRVGDESFFTYTKNASDTAAKRIYDYMRTSRRVYGSADLRHPEQMPFGDEDELSTPRDQSITFAPLANDDVKVPNGVTNILRLVEVGALYPPSAGEVQMEGDSITFTPAQDYEGEVWFTYTLGGNQGNNGQGWLHSADVIISVGTGGSPSTNPALSVPHQVYKVDLDANVALKPLLRTSGSGNLWVGSVDVQQGPAGWTRDVGNSLHLVSARVLMGNGALHLEQRAVVDGNQASSGYTGLMTYVPGGKELGEVVLEYTVEDSQGNRSTNLITLLPRTEYDEWISQYGLSGSDADATGDPNGNLIANLLEFSRNTNPTQPDGASPPALVSFQTEPEPGENTAVLGEPRTYLQITYNRRAGGTGLSGVNYTVDGIRYRVEVADDLAGPWRHGTDVVQSVGSPQLNDDGTETVTIRSRTALEDGPGSGYIRYRVERVE